MPEELGYILRPVHAGMCRLESAYDFSLDLYDFGIMNDYLDCDSENRRRVDAYYKDKSR